MDELIDQVDDEVLFVSFRPFGNSDLNLFCMEFSFPSFKNFNDFHFGVFLDFDFMISLVNV